MTDETDTTSPTAAMEPATAPDAAPTPPKAHSASAQALAVVKTTLREFDAVEAGLLKLEKRHAGVVFDVSTTKGMAEATKARSEIREPRYATKKALDAGKSVLNSMKSDMTERASAITARILALETPVDDQIKAEERRKAEEKEAREAADRTRVLAITERITAIRATVTRATEVRTAARVLEISEALRTTDLTGFDEFEPEGVKAHADALATLSEIYANKLTDELERERQRAERAAEQAQLEEERKALAAQRAEIERQQAEIEQQRAAMAEEEAARTRLAESIQREEAQRAAAAAAAEAEAAQAAAPQIAPDDEADIVDAEVPPNFMAGQQWSPEERADFDKGFDAAIAGPITFVPRIPPKATDSEIMSVAIEAVASFFDIHELSAAGRLSMMQQWQWSEAIAKLNQPQEQAA